MTRPPVVGIVGASHDVGRPWGTLRTTGVPRSYVDAVAGAGGLPVVLPLSGPPAVLDVVDAVVLTGGGDVDPRRYGAPATEARDVDPERDQYELDVVRAAADRRLPLLGVCRGLQLLAVAAGGRLGGLGLRHVRPDEGHRVDLEVGSVLAGLLGTSPLVSSVHEQEVVDPGRGWRVVGRAADGVVEACERAGDDGWPAVGVQWHPELDATGAALFGWLVASAQVRAGEGSRATETSSVAGTSRTATTHSASSVPIRSPRWPSAGGPARKAV